MKKQVILMSLACVLASISFAQNSSTLKRDDLSDDQTSSQGVRVGVVKSMLKSEIAARYQGFSGSSSENIDSTTGVSLGYAKLPVQALGFTSNLTYLDFRDNGDPAGALRADGNLAFAFTKFLNAKGGINVSKFTSGKGLTDLNAGIGFQAGLGVQMTKNIGLDVGYTEMNQSGTFQGIDLSTKQKGMEIGLTGTF